MTIDDGARLALHRKLEDVLGSEDAGTLMSHLPPVTWQQVATKDDLAQLSTRLEARSDTATADVRSEIAALRGEFGELRAEFGELRGEFSGLRSHVESELTLVRGEVHMLRTDVTASIDRAIAAQTWRLATFVAGWGALIVAVVGLVR